MPRARRSYHAELHAVERIDWLRAAVLGANDGIVSTASLIVGVAATGADRDALLIAGGAGLVAGAMSMAAGEYVSVSSQRDAEQADIRREKRELAEMPEMERQELTNIYIERGLDPDLAQQVADQLTAKDALGAHTRDELGISELTEARPIQAAFASAISFALGAGLPLLITWLAPIDGLEIWVGSGSLVYLALLGFLGAYAGGAKPLKPTARVVFWGAVAMAITAGIGRLFGAVV
ncbi:MAG TPA: VIT family protein [Hyphomonadaceae bacterium]|nr:VIT family protein [Hyphomonadaceae bacterium]HPN04534.1 VIT family protein [Hyphomonadaceae bacterium]